MTISPNRQRHLVVMVKEPRPGAVKTRLGRDIGMVPAAWWYRHQCKSILRKLSDPRWVIWLAVSPDREGLRSRVWPSELRKLPQGPGDLGQRMARVFRSLPPGPVVIIGSDIPGVTRNGITDAFRALGQADGVIGPSPDGGYWLIGLRRSCAVPANLFAHVRWSSPTARSDSLATMPPNTTLIRSLNDVDRAEDL